jgi:hypothetical protein
MNVLGKIKNCRYALMGNFISAILNIGKKIIIFADVRDNTRREMVPCNGMSK